MDSTRRAIKPLEILGRWLDEAAEAQLPAPRAMTLVTATADGRPSARLVTLKRLEDDGLVFTTGLWTRKVEELRDNPAVATTFYWPALGRQARVEGHAAIAASGAGRGAVRRSASRPPVAGAGLSPG